MDLKAGFRQVAPSPEAAPWCELRSVLCPAPARGNRQHCARPGRARAGAWALEHGGWGPSCSSPRHGRECAAKERGGTARCRAKHPAADGGKESRTISLSAASPSLAQ